MSEIIDLETVRRERLQSVRDAIDVFEGLDLYDPSILDYRQGLENVITAFKRHGRPSPADGRLLLGLAWAVAGEGWGPGQLPS